MALRQSATRSLRIASRNVPPTTRAFSVSALRQKELAADVSDFPNMRVGLLQSHSLPVATLDIDN